VRAAADFPCPRSRGCGQKDRDRFNAALLTVAPGAPATPRVDFYDRSGAVIQSITFDES